MGLQNQSNVCPLSGRRLPRYRGDGSGRAGDTVAAEDENGAHCSHMIPTAFKTALTTSVDKTCRLLHNHVLGPLLSNAARWFLFIFAPLKDSRRFWQWDDGG